MTTELNETFDHGKKISPVLPEGKKNFLIDIDGTVCEDIPNEEPERMAGAALYPDALRTCNSWYDEGRILFGKPRGGNYHWIDNDIARATRYIGKSTDLVEADAKIQLFR